MRRPLTPLLLLTFALPAQQTWLVDPNGGGHFTDLGAAITTAAANDVLLLAAGAWFGGSYQIDKSLVVIGLPGATQPVRIAELTIAQGSQPDPLVRMSHLQLMNVDIRAPAAFEDVQTLRCRSSAPRVSFHRSTLSDLGTYSYGAGLVVQSGDVVLTECTVTGRNYATTLHGGICTTCGVPVVGPAGFEPATS